jgi:hypothetical protein
MLLAANDGIPIIVNLGVIATPDNVDREVRREAKTRRARTWRKSRANLALGKPALVVRRLA